MWWRASGVCVEGRSVLGLGNLPQMKSDAIPGDQCEQTVQSCRNSISTWLDSPRVPLYWTPPIPLSLGLPSCPSRTPVNKATQEQRSPSVPLKWGDYMARVHVCVSMACGEVCIYACMHGPCVCVDVAYLDQPIHTHTWSQLAVNEVPDRHSTGRHTPNGSCQSRHGG